MSSAIENGNPEEENGLTTEKNQKNSFLDSFTRITHNAPKLRLKSGIHIVRHLSKNNENNDELKYTIGRLVRGLGSAKLNSRIGFYTTLVVLLRTRNKYDVNDILDVVSKELQTSGQNSKSENADILSGLILTCGAVLHAGKFENLDNDKRKALLEHLVTASSKKTYLGLLASSLMVDALPKIQQSTFAEDVLPIFRPQLKKNLAEYTLDNLYLLLKFEEHFPAVITSKFLQNLITSSKTISESNVKPISNILLNVIPIKNLTKHPVYEYVSKRFSATSFMSKVFAVLDENFSKATQMRHQVLAVFLTHLVNNLQDVDLLPSIIGKNFLIESLDHYKSTTIKQQDEIKVAVSCLLDSISKFAKKPEVSSKTKVTFMKKLMFYPGSFIFEKITGSKVLQQITATLDTGGVKELAKIYKKVILAELEKKKNEVETETWLNLDRVYAAQLFTKLVNHPNVRSELDWRTEQLELLMDVGLMKRTGVGYDLVKPLKDTFFHSLNIKLGKLSDVVSCYSKLVHALVERKYDLRVMLEPEVQELFDNAIRIVDKMATKSKTKTLTVVFQTLFLHMALQLFNDEKLASDSLQELFSCYKRRKSKDLDVPWVEVVVDLFLNLLSHNSHLLRSIIGKVFPHLCKHLTATAVHQILHVLDPKSDDNPLSEDVSDDEEDDDEDEDEDDESMEEEEDEDGDEFEETQNDKLRQAIQDVLIQGKNLSSDSESIDLDKMSNSECDKLNTALGAAFIQFRPNLSRRKTKKQSRDDETLTHFRVRVMDLLYIYLDSSEVSMLICLEIMLPLLQSLEFSIRDAHQKPLHDRIKATLKKLSGLKQFATDEDVDENILQTLLQSILDKGSKSVLMVQEMGDKIADCCMFIINCSQMISLGKKKSLIQTVMLETLDTFFKKRDCLTPYVLFKNVMASNWERSVSLVSPLIGYVFDEELRPFRRRQGLELLKIFYLNNRLIAAHKETYMKKFAKNESQLKNCIVEFFEKKEYKHKETFLIALFMLLAAIKKCCIQTEMFDWAQVGQLVREYRSGVSFSNDGKSAYNKLCGVLKVPNAVKMKKTVVKLSAVNKNAANDVLEEDNEEATGEAKKKGNKEAKRLKKETRNLRMASLSEGMRKSFDFAEQDVDQLNEFALEVKDRNAVAAENSDEEAENVEVAIQKNGRQKVKMDKKRKNPEHEQTQVESPKKKKKRDV